MTSELIPAESLALTVALGQLHRGEQITENVAVVCVLALGRLAGRVSYDPDDNENAYRVFPPGQSPPPP